MMNAPINYTVIEHDGKPVKVLVDYAQFLELLEKAGAEATIPHAVVKEVYGKNALTAAAAWRRYRAMSQREVAKAMGISQSGYQQIEKSTGNLRKATKKKLAAAFHIALDQLDV